MKKRILTLIGIVALAFCGVKAQDNNVMNKENEVPAGPVVDIVTNLGTIQVKLYDDTPKHRDNFLKLAREGFYDGVLFHRVIKDFMVQTGDPQSVGADSTQMLGSGGPGYQIDAEILYPKHYHKYGALAAARTGDAINPERKSSGSQFYIVTGNKYTEQQLEGMGDRQTMNRRQEYFNNLCRQNEQKIRDLQNANDKQALEDLRQQLIKETEEHVKVEPLPEQLRQDYTTIGGTPHLDGQYTVFGEVLKGMDVVEKIQNAATGRADRPKEDIKILSTKVE